MNEEFKNEKVKQIDIYPCTRWRRVLAWLADFFICFIATVFLEIVVAQPISNAVVDFKQMDKDYTAARENNVNLLCSNNLLFSGDLSKGNLTESIKYTCEKYTNELVLKSEENKYDVFKNFYKFRGKDFDELLDIYSTRASKFFDVNKEDKTITLKENYITLFAPKFNAKDEISEVGKTAYSEFEEKYFLNFYADIILEDINQNDLVSKEHPEYGSYFLNNKITHDIDQKINFVTTINSSVSFGIVMLIFYIVIPLTNRKGSTCAELILKIERIDINSIRYLKKRFIFAVGLINILSNTIMLVFIPSIVLGLGPAFRLKELFSLSIVGFIFMLIQLCLMLFTKMNQSLKEFSTHSICVDTDTMDTYFREHGYDF